MLNRLPEVKKFIKGGEAETYEGVTVEYIRGRKPVLTIYEDGVKREEVEMATHTSVESLHSLMEEKGFHKKGGVAGKSAAVDTSSKALAGKERLEKIPVGGAQGDVVANEDVLESTPMHAFGYFTAAVIGGFLIYSIAKNRSKNEHDSL